MGAASAVCASSLIRYYGTFVVSVRRPVKDILTSDNRGINEMFAGDVSAVCPYLLWSVLFFLEIFTVVVVVVVVSIVASTAIFCRLSWWMCRASQ